MNKDLFRIMVVNLNTARGSVVSLEGRERVAGGSGLAAELFTHYGHADRPWDDPLQPLIFAIGPLTGYFPLMSKTVCGFKAPYHDQYTESHGGGRSALAIKFCRLDGLVITGKSSTPCFVDLGANHLHIREAGFLWGMDVLESGKVLRRLTKGAGHRSILRIGPAGENGAAMASINVDTYRHFGRLGGGAVMGAKNLKGIVFQGDAVLDLPEGKSYPNLFAKVYSQVTSTDMMKKYHSLGTPANLRPLNDLKSLPWRNLQATHDPGVEAISGERFARDTLLRNSACAGCPVGCIHVGFVREKFMADHRYLYRQVGYDYEPIFSLGTMLGVTESSGVLNILDTMERTGLDAMSGGVALAWATEATEKGLINERETMVPLAFGNAENYREAAELFGVGANEFYRLLGMGTLQAAEEYGGKDFACVLGQEMAGYATGEVFFAAQSLGFRHSHLDTGGYSYDQKHAEQDINGVVAFLMEDEAGRAFMTSMVACLFARKVYSEEVMADCLEVLGLPQLAADPGQTGRYIQQLRWRTRIATGFRPEEVTIPKRFLKVKTWKGPIDPKYLQGLKTAYAEAILNLVSPP